MIRYSFIRKENLMDDFVARLIRSNLKWGWKTACPLFFHFGVDDIDGTVVEEKITRSAGADTEQSLTKNELVRMIKEAGRIPVERDTLYNNLSS